MAPPLLGVIGGGLGGLALAGDPKNLIPLWELSLGGAGAGLVAGLIVWSIDRRRPSPKRLGEIWSPGFAAAEASRLTGFCLLAVGLTCLGATMPWLYLARRNSCRSCSAAHSFWLLVWEGLLYRNY